MPWIETTIEFLPAGAADEADHYVEVDVEIEFDFSPYEAAVMDVNSPFVGPGCDASASLIESTIRRPDGEPVCDALLAAIKAWWRHSGEEKAIEQEESRS